jgi:hypothetical protein
MPLLDVFTLHYHSMFVFGGLAILGLLVLARILMR